MMFTGCTGEGHQQHEHNPPDQGSCEAVNNNQPAAEQLAGEITDISTDDRPSCSKTPEVPTSSG